MYFALCISLPGKFLAVYLVLPCCMPRRLKCAASVGFLQKPTTQEGGQTGTRVSFLRASNAI
jgi:hypothetical protein